MGANLTQPCPLYQSLGGSWSAPLAWADLGVGLSLGSGTFKVCILQSQWWTDGLFPLLIHHPRMVRPGSWESPRLQPASRGVLGTRCKGHHASPSIITLGSYPMDAHVPQAHQCGTPSSGLKSSSWGEEDLRPVVAVVAGPSTAPGALLGFPLVHRGPRAGVGGSLHLLPGAPCLGTSVHLACAPLPG